MLLRSAQKSKNNIMAPETRVETMEYEEEDLMTDDETKSTISSIRPPDDDQLVVDNQSYPEYIKSITNDVYCTLDSLRRTKEDEKKSIYGLIKFVTGNQSRPMVTVEDVTGSFSMTLPKLTADFTIGNVIRIEDMVRRGNAFEFVNGVTRYHQIQTFEYDYSSSSENSAFVNTYDREMTRLLETFLANRLFSCTLDTLTNVPSSEKSYRDLCGEVVANREMIRSIALSFWDGTLPSNEIYDPYKPEYGKDSKLNEKYANCTKNKTAHINIWANESGLHCFHFLTARSFLSDNDDMSFAAFFNVEISKLYDETVLNLRSGLHKGKCIRKVSKNSILGKMLLKRIDSNFYQIDEVTEEPSQKWDTSIISSIPVTRTIRNNTLRDVTTRTQNSSTRHQDLHIVDKSTNATTVEYADTTEEVRNLLRKLPSYLSIQTMKDMDIDSLLHFKEVIEMTDDVEELKLDWSEHLTKEEFVEIVKIVIDWKRAGCLTGMIPDEIF